MVNDLNVCILFVVFTVCGAITCEKCYGNLRLDLTHPSQEAFEFIFHIRCQWIRNYWDCLKLMVIDVIDMLGNCLFVAYKV